MQYSWEDCWEMVTGENPSSASEWMAFDQAADVIGYREVVDEPIAFLAPFDVTEDGQGVWTRTKMLAAHYEDDLPLMNLIHQDVDVDVLERIREESDHDRVALRIYAPDNIDISVSDYLQEEDFYRPLDRIAARVFGHKDSMADMFRDSDMPVLPSRDLGSVILYGLHEDSIGEFDEYVLLPSKGGNGTNVEKVATTSEATEYLKGMNDGHEWYEYFMERKASDKNGYQACGIQVEPFIEHDADIRMYVGDGVLSAEERIGREDDFRCNLSLLDGGAAAEKAFVARETGAAQVLSVNHHREGVERLPEEARRIGEDLIDWVSGDPEEYFLAVDVLVGDRDEVEKLPEAWRDPILEYANDDNAYILSEINLIGGDIIGHLHYWDGPREEIPVIHEYRQLQQLAGVDPVDPENIVDNPESTVWQRIDDHYMDLDTASDVYGPRLARYQDPVRGL